MPYHTTYSLIKGKVYLKRQLYFQCQKVFKVSKGTAGEKPQKLEWSITLDSHQHVAALDAPQRTKHLLHFCKRCQEYVVCVLTKFGVFQHASVAVFNRHRWLLQK